jgi:hypothetical protein
MALFHGSRLLKGGDIEQSVFWLQQQMSANIVMYGKTKMKGSATFCLVSITTSHAMQKSCKTCANLLISDSATTGYRCGQTYFNQPPAERKMKRMETYPQTDEQDICVLYQLGGNQLRTILSKQPKLDISSSED